MEKSSISSGKRPRNPLLKRVWKDIARDWKRYLMIWIMLVVTIGFVSGMFVANNSMLHTLDANTSILRCEDGHFRLSAKADSALLAGIASGEKADVAEVFRQRAYSEAEDEVQKAVDEAIAEKTEEQVRLAIRTQVENAVDSQLETAKAGGAKITDQERQSMIDAVLESAMAENFDKALSEALDTAKDSDEYADALADAMDEAKKEIDKEIDEKYAELAERYDLEEECDPVPVNIYELFYKETDETFSGDDSYSGSVRVYSQRSEVDLFDLLKGREPETDSEIIIDRMHADNAGISLGDTLYAGNAAFEVVGLAAFVDYSTLYENNNDTMFDALTFDAAMVTDEGFSRIRSNTRANYAYTYKKAPADEFEEKEMSENFMKALITQVAVSENEDLKIDDFVPAYLNNAMNFAENDLGKDKAMGGVLLYILTAVLAFIFAVTISTTLEQESSVIGTLRASGYSRGELLRYYMSAPLLVVLVAAVAGNILGYTFFKNVIVSMYYNSYSLPSYETMWTPEAFIRTTIVPIVLMLIINMVVIIHTLRLSPLRFLRHDLKRNKRKKAVRLPKWNFFQRFRIRVFLQNIPNYLMLFVGITFVMLLLSMAVGMPETLSYYQDNMPGTVFAQEQVILSSTEDEDGNIIETAAKGAERFSALSLERKSDSYNEEITVYGIADNSKFIHMSKSFISNATSEGTVPVVISQAYSEKYNLSQGDIITLSEKYEHKDYTMKVAEVNDYSAALAVFMTNEQFNQVFDNDPDDFTGYISDEKITDIDEEYIVKEITADDMMKIAKQLDHSMGSYMTYFQYVCMIVAAIILYLLTKIIIEKNERAISMTKILGYENGEIASLYLIPTAIVVFFSEFLAMYLGYILMIIFWKSMMMGMGGWFAFKMSAGGFVKEFILVFAAYLIITVIDFVRIKNIPKVLALKNME